MPVRQRAMHFVSGIARGLLEINEREETSPYVSFWVLFFRFYALVSDSLSDLGSVKHWPCVFSLGTIQGIAADEYLFYPGFGED